MYKSDELTVTVRVKDLLSVYKLLHTFYNGVPRRSFYDWLYGRNREDIFDDKIQHGKRKIDHMLNEFGVPLQIQNSVDVPNIDELVRKMGGKKWQKNM